MRRRKILLTGATGFLGRHLLRELLLAGREVVVLARDAGGVSASDRIDALLASWGDSFPRPAVIAGDVSEPSLGLGAADRAWMRRACAAVLHTAAHVGFRATADGEPWQANLVGTRNVAELANALGIEELHHVSTAFVCGRRAGPIREDDLDRGQDFHNDYERSKFEAERFLRQSSRARVTVYRPSVIVGDSRTGYTSSYNGVYRFLDQAERLSRQLSAGTRSLPMRLPFVGDEPRDFVPVDWVAKAITRIAARPPCHGATYHLTAARPTPVAWVKEAAEEALGLEGLTYGGPSLPDPSPLEALFLGRVRDYWPYLAGDPNFDRSHTLAALPHLPAPVVDRASLVRMIRFAVADGWGRERRPGPAAAPIDCRYYVEDFFPEAVRHSALARVPIDVAVVFDVRGDGGGRWTLRWVDGELTGVEPGRCDTAEVVYRADADAFAAVVSGRLTVHEAHETRRIEIDGHLEKGLKLAALFAQFVRECPFDGSAVPVG